MAKVLSRKSLTKKLDNLCLKIVRLRDEDTCQRCGKKCYGCDAHTSHVAAKGNGASYRRFDLLNVFLLCSHCHLYWWHKEPTESGKWFAKKFPIREKYLERYRGGQPSKIDDAAMLDLVVALEEKVVDLEER